jgi:hypothetical protein
MGRIDEVSHKVSAAAAYFESLLLRLSLCIIAASVFHFFFFAIEFSGPFASQ